MGVTRQLHPLIQALAGAEDGLNLTIHQLAHTREESEDIPAEIS